MNTIPIAFAFDSNLILPAAVAITSLLENAKEETFYDIFILHSSRENLDKTYFNTLQAHYHNCHITFRTVSNEFDDSFEIRGITTPAYYRLLIPEIIPEYDKIIYSDTDVIFRNDLSNIYTNTDIKDNYFAGVNSISHRDFDTNKYYISNHLNPEKIIYSGNLIINSKLIREDKLTKEFIKHSTQKYRFQDMDIINRVCIDKIYFLPPWFCWTNYIHKEYINNPKEICEFFTHKELQYAYDNGTIHYNGQKPWKGLCINFDIWWEYYRKSPIFDEKFYFNFYWSRLDELDQLSLWKRIKILGRYFIYGRKKPL